LLCKLGTRTHSLDHGRQKYHLSSLGHLQRTLLLLARAHLELLQINLCHQIHIESPAASHRIRPLEVTAQPCLPTDVNPEAAFLPQQELDPALDVNTRVVKPRMACWEAGHGERCDQASVAFDGNMKRLCLGGSRSCFPVGLASQHIRAKTWVQ